MFQRSLALVTLLLAAAACEAPTAPGELGSLEAARAAWRLRGSESYTYTVSRGCYCVLGGQLVAVSVWNGSVIAAEYAESGAAVDAALFTYVPTVADLFDLIGSALDGKPAYFAATYHPLFGYPTRIEIDYSANAVDDELSISARDLTLSVNTDR